MRYTWMIASAAVLSLGAAPSFANKASADACAAKLSPEAKQIYTASIGSIAPGVDMREVVRGKARSLVMGGQLTRDQARPAAEAAGACLKQAL
jgi:hypothetical protein